MLPKTYRFHAVNKTGVTVANIDVHTIRSKFSSTGALEYKSADPTQTITATGVTNNTVANSGNQDNSFDLMLKLEGHLRVNITSGTPSGSVNLYMQISRDGGTTWPTDETGTLVRVINFTATDDKREQFTWQGS